MGNVAGYRQAFADAQDYMEDWKEYDAKRAKYEKDQRGRRRGRDDRRSRRSATSSSRRSPRSMHGDILVHIHCYRADEMATMLDLAKEFGFKIAAFHHGVEAYKLADRLAAEGVCGALWADWWGFKMEAFDGIQENLALVDLPQGGCAIVHSDSAEGIQRLNQEAAKAMTRGQRAGLDIPPERAIRWVTANPAKALGILEQTGTLEAGKMGDVVVWNGTPFSVYAHAEQVFVDGALLYDRAHPAPKPRSDFLLGQKARAVTSPASPRSLAPALAGAAQDLLDPRRARAHGRRRRHARERRRAGAGRAHRGGRRRPRGAPGRDGRRGEWPARDARAVRRRHPDRPGGSAASKPSTVDAELKLDRARAGSTCGGRSSTSRPHSIRARRSCRSCASRA